MKSKFNSIFVLSALMLLSFSGFTSLTFIDNQLILARVNDNANPNPEPLKVNVQVLNTGNTNLIGSIHVISDITGATKNSNGITFPAGQTIIKPFEFNLSEIPKGTNYNVEVVYGDDYSKRVSAVNNQTENKPTAFISINIP